MLYLRLAMASLLLFSPLSSVSLTEQQSNLVPCKKKESLGQKDVNVKWSFCPKKDRDGGYHREDPPITEKQEKPKYDFRDFDSCSPTNDSFMGCRSNPDLKVCDDGSYPIIRQILVLEGNDKGGILDSFRVCPEDPKDERIERIKKESVSVSLEQFRSFPIIASNISSSPAKFSLRNGHSHLWATREVQSFDLEIGQSSVRIKAIPIQWNWNYGDGTTRNLSFPGEPMPHHTLRDETPTSHSYGETGTFKVGVTTLYRGEFSVDGGAWQAIPGQAAVASVPIEIDVWRTEKELIAND